MKKTLVIIALLLLLSLFSCGEEEKIEIPKYNIGAPNTGGVGKDDTSFGEDISADLNEGKFDEAVSTASVSCVSGTQGAYSISDGVLTFSGITQDSVYSLSGQLKGNIVVDIDSAYKLEIELTGFSLISDTACPVVILGGDKVILTAKKETKNIKDKIN